MRFGGHETFAVREGWLSKGLSLVKKDPDAFNDPFVSDRLGVGRNMAKSIFHWLTVTGLARKEGRSRSLRMTEVGNVVFSHDPYFLSVGTWWALHVNLLLHEEDAVVWKVFFNSFPRERFDRAGCVEELRRHIALESKRLPSVKTLARDVSCMLASYATPLPPETGDPEEGNESPFRSLGLVTYLKESGIYRVNRGRRDIPPALLGYAISKAFLEDHGEEFSDIGFSKAFASPGGPGRVLCLNIEGLSDIIDRAEEHLGSKLVHSRQLGGERFIRIKHLSASNWLKKYYADSRTRRDH